MNRLITFLAGTAVVPLTALAIAGCGGGGGGGGATESPAPPKTPSGQQATIGTANGSELGTILVDSKGRTLYLFRKDSTTKSSCFGECASDWPPLRTSGKPMVGGGASASMVGSTPRSDGKQQVTYNGHPLYLYAGDEKAGDTAGQGVTAFGAGWYALTPAGKQVSGQASSAGGSSPGGGY